MSASPFLRSIREHMLVRRYSLRTIKAYLYWIKYFILFHHKRHPGELTDADVEAFLSLLAVHGQVSAGTQSLALNALVFLYKFLKRPCFFVEKVRDIVGLYLNPPDKAHSLF